MSEIKKDILNQNLWIDVDIKKVYLDKKIQLMI